MSGIAVQVVAIVLLAPLVQGTMKWLRARWQGRPGPSPVQPYRDLRKLWGKEAVLPEGVSVITAWAPGIVLGVALTFAAMLRVGPDRPPVWDAVALVLLLALGRFVLALAALDVRSGFTGMAASREMTFAALAEPTLLLTLIGGPNLLAFAALCLTLLLETARVPIDNQETHYELTMMHEGLTLEYSGWQLALVHVAAYVRQLAFFVLAAAVLAPQGGPAAAAAIVVVLMAAITLTETLFAKVRLFEIPQILTSAFILAATGLALHLAGIGG